MLVGKDTIQDLVDMYLKMRICQINRKMSACLNRKHCTRQRKILYKPPPDRTVPSVSRPSPQPQPHTPRPVAAVGPYQPPIIPQAVAIYNTDPIPPIPTTIPPLPYYAPPLPTRPPWITYPTSWDAPTQIGQQLPGTRQTEHRPAPPRPAGERQPEHRPAEPRRPASPAQRPPRPPRPADRPQEPTRFVPEPTGPSRPAPEQKEEVGDQKEQKEDPRVRPVQPQPPPPVPPSPGYGVRPEAGEARFQHQGPLPVAIRAQIDYGAVPQGAPVNHPRAYQIEGDHRWYLRTGNEDESNYHYYWVYNDQSLLWGPKHGRSRRTKAGRADR